MVPMERLTWVGGSFAAHVLAARLQDEGIDAELRGALDGPYGLTMGDMARVDVYVPVEQLDDARLVLLSNEIDAVEAGDADEARSDRRPAVAMWLVVAVILAAALAPVLRYFVSG